MKKRFEDWVTFRIVQDKTLRTTSIERNSRADRQPGLNEKAQSAAMGGGFGGTSDLPVQPMDWVGVGQRRRQGIEQSARRVAFDRSKEQYRRFFFEFFVDSKGRRRVFFLRNGQWIDSRVGDNAPSTANKIDRFSDAYFAIVEKHASFLEPLLDLQEPIVVELDGNVYIL